MVGAQIVIASREKARDGQALGELLARCNATVTQATPSTWKMDIVRRLEGESHLKILCGGEPWPTDLAQQLLEKCDSLWHAGTGPRRRPFGLRLAGLIRMKRY